MYCSCGGVGGWGVGGLICEATGEELMPSVPVEIAHCWKKHHYGSNHDQVKRIPLIKG